MRIVAFIAVIALAALISGLSAQQPNSPGTLPPSVKGETCSFTSQSRCRLTSRCPTRLNLRVARRRRSCVRDKCVSLASDPTQFDKCQTACNSKFQRLCYQRIHCTRVKVCGQLRRARCVYSLRFRRNGSQRRCLSVVRAFSDALGRRRRALFRRRLSRLFSIRTPRVFRRNREDSGDDAFREKVVISDAQNRSNEKSKQVALIQADEQPQLGEQVNESQLLNDADSDSEKDQLRQLIVLFNRHKSARRFGCRLKSRCDRAYICQQNCPRSVIHRVRAYCRKSYPELKNKKVTKRAADYCSRGWCLRTVTSHKHRRLVRFGDNVNSCLQECAYRNTIRAMRQQRRQERQQRNQQLCATYMTQFRQCSKGAVICHAVFTAARRSHITLGRKHWFATQS